MNKLLANNECTSTSEIYTIINNFKAYLNVIDYTSKEELPLQFFQKSLEYVMNYAKATDEFCKKRKPKKLQQYEIFVHLMKLCSICQLCSSKCLHFNKSLEDDVLTELARCVCKRLTTLLVDAIEVFSKTEIIHDDIGIFVKLMNTALDKISQIDISEGSDLACSNLENAHKIIEEILCFSMAIAQVAVDDDPKIITIRCQLVLEALENIKTEIMAEAPTNAEINLVVDNCTDALCTLEAQVNTAVLRLCLKVFSEYKQPLDNLINNTYNDALVTNFDLNMDRIFQIALFSIASSAVGKGVATIQAVMFNLEFLEAELIPAIIATANKPNEKGFINILGRFWCEQVASLRDTIHTIIEPAAYCKLIYEELQIKTDKLWITVTNLEAIESSQLDPFINYGQELSKVITTCLDCFNQNQQKEVKRRLKIVHCMLSELISLRKLLDETANSFQSTRSLFKRCQVLLKEVKSLWLTVVDNNQQDKTLKDKEEFVVKGNGAEDNVQLTQIINKSKQLVKSRSIYSTHQTVCYSMTKNSKIVNDNRNRNYTFAIYKNDEDFSIIDNICPIIETTLCRGNINYK